MKNCKQCEKSMKETLFGSDRSLKMPDGKVLFFCTSICREKYKKEHNLQAYHRKP